MGSQQFDARARSLPTTAIQLPLTRPVRSLGKTQAKRTATPRQIASGPRKHRARTHQHRRTRKENEGQNQNEDKMA